MSVENTYFNFPIVKESQYLIFVLQEKKLKTNVYGVLSSKQTFIESGVTPRHVELGIIKWHGPYRKYAFFPEPETVFDRACLKEITEFINRDALKNNLNDGQESETHRSQDDT